MVKKAAKGKKSAVKVNKPAAPAKKAAPKAAGRSDTGRAAAAKKFDQPGAPWWKQYLPK